MTIEFESHVNKRVQFHPRRELAIGFLRYEALRI